MKSFLKVLCVIALSCAAPLTFAQSGQGLLRPFGHYVPGLGSRHLQLVQVTDSQHEDLANCVAAIKQVQRIVNQMSQIGSHWGRGRINYSRSALAFFSDREQALKEALTALETNHEALRKDLAGFHDPSLDKSLRTLKRLQAKLNSDSAQIDRDLVTARPGPWSPELSWDVHAVRNAANKVHAELEQIARKLDLPKSPVPSAAWHGSSSHRVTIDLPRPRMPGTGHSSCPSSTYVTTALQRATSQERYAALLGLQKADNPQSHNDVPAPAASW